MKEICMLLIIALTSLQACSASSQNTSLGDCGVNEGFCGEHAYRVSATGVPRSSEKVISARKDQAITAAVMMARVRMLEKFRGYCVQLVPWQYPDNLGKEARERCRELLKMNKVFFSELESKIHQGSVLKADWDSVQNCTVLYEFKMQGLKARIDRCY